MQIRERSFLDILDLALVVVRQKPVPIVLAALVGAVPFAALNAWLMGQEDFPVGLYPFLLVLEIPWATAPLTVVLGGLMFGERPTAGRTIKSMWSSIVALALFQGLLRGILVITLVLTPLLPLRWAFLNEVILLERGRWRSLLRRCSTICQGREGDLFIQSMAQFFFGGLFVLAFWAGSMALIQGLSTSELTWQPAWSDLLGWRFHLAVWGAIEFFAIARFLNYIDHRIRLEGWEVELRVRAVARTQEEAGRW